MLIEKDIDQPIQGLRIGESEPERLQSEIKTASTRDPLKYLPVFSVVDLLPCDNAVLKEPHNSILSEMCVNSAMQPLLPELADSNHFVSREDSPEIGGCLEHEPDLIKIMKAREGLHAMRIDG